MKSGWIIPGKPGEPPEMGERSEYLGYVMNHELESLGINPVSSLGGRRLTPEQDKALGEYLRRRRLAGDA